MVLRAALAAALLVAGAEPLLAQRTDYERKAAEYNAYQDIERAQTPAEKLTYIDAFLKSYPQSNYRAFVYRVYWQAALGAKQFGKAMDAVDGFLSLDRSAVLAAYREGNPNLEDSALDSIYFEATLINTYAFLQGFKDGTPQSDAIAAKSEARAKQGLQLLVKVYSQAQVTDPNQKQQLEQQRRQQEAAFHSVLGFVTYRKQDYAAAARDYALLVEMDPNNVFYHNRLWVSYLKQQPPQWLPGLWTLARTVNLTPGDKKSLRDSLVQNLAASEGAVDAACVEDQAQELLELSKQSVTPPAELKLPAREEIEAIRGELSIAKLMDGLKAGGDTARKTWLAGCRLPIPEIQGIVLAVENDAAAPAMKFKIAITDEAAAAGTPQIVLHISGQPEAKVVRADDEIGFTGVMSSYQSDPFLLTLTDGKINPETLPKTRRRGGASAR
jgi:hypothetical protein